MSRRSALALFSGGLDSILATRLVMDQGIDVTAVKFVTPFFHYEILADVAAYQAAVMARYGIKVVVEDISPGYLAMMHQPAHGFGRNFNPCIDCKILMVRRAREMLAELGASFLISGEVLGQRPMSQRRDTLSVIERDSGSRTLLLRPLSAKLLNPTQAELEGWVDRERLLDLSGRGRARQIALAKSFGLSDFPSPAGGCILADPILGRRIRLIYNDKLNITTAMMTVSDFRLLLLGRQFRLPGGGWLILGRNEAENDRVHGMAEAGDALLHMEVRSGPAALLRRADQSYAGEAERDADLAMAASLVVRYGKKNAIEPQTGEVLCWYQGQCRVLVADPPEDDGYMEWML